MKRVFASARMAVILLVAVVARGYAQEGDFYAGKQIQFVIRSEAGSSYDQYSRLVGRYMRLHIPGTPTIVPINMPGSGGVTAANFVAVRAPKDGTVLTMVGQGLPADQALGLNKSLQADLNTFNWIGNIDRSNQLIITWHASPIRTIHDAIAQRSSFGTAGAGSISTQVPAMLNSLAGTRFNIVMGYPGPGNLLAAMERGEVDDTLFTWAAIKSLRPDYIANHLINVIAQVGLEAEDDLPDVPLMRHLARDPSDRAVMDYISKSVAVGRPIATTPGVPIERVTILRKAFDDTLNDPEFVAQARKQNLEIKAMNGADLQQLVKDVAEISPDLRARIRKAIQLTQ